MDNSLYGYEEPISSNDPHGASCQYANMASKKVNIPDTYLNTSPISAGSQHYYQITGNVPYDNDYQSLLDTRKRGECDLSYRSLSTLSDDIVNNNSITVLILDSNQFIQIPENLFKMWSLTYLSLASQMTSKRASVTQKPAIEHIPQDIHRLHNLSYLILCNNALQQLPKTTSRLKMLVHIDLRLNQLQMFPSCLCDMISLREILLSGNSIESLPKEIKNLKDLQTLRIGNNMLTYIPGELCELTGLTCLSLQRNNIKDLPSDMYKLTGLLPLHKGQEKRLFLEDNPLRYPPENIVTQGTESIFKFLKSNKQKVRDKVKPSEQKTNLIGKEFARSRDTPLERTDGLSRRDRSWSSSSYVNSSGYDAQDGSRISCDTKVSAVISVNSKPILRKKPNMEKVTKVSNHTFVKEKGFIFRDSILEDSNCLFHALSDQLNRPGIALDHQDHVQLRKNMVKYLKENEHQGFSDWLTETSQTSYDEYVNEIANNEQWATEMAVHIMARVLGRNILIVKSSEVMECGHNMDEKKLLLGNPHGVYYQSLGLPEDQEMERMPYPSDCVEILDERVSLSVNYLDLSNRKLEALPEKITELKKLNTLLLNKNCLAGNDWASKLKMLPSLEKISIRNQESNKNENGYQIMHKMPENIFLCTSLTHLCMRQNKISVIPVDIIYLKALRVLDLINNRINRIPDEIQQLTELQYLGLSNNIIGSIPESIGQLSNLMVLRLSHNELRELPDALCNLSNLIVLSLSFNQLYYLPARLCQLSGLKSEKVFECDLLERSHLKAGFWMEKNENIQFPPKGKCDEGGLHVLDFMKDMSKDVTRRNTLIMRAKDSMVHKHKLAPLDSLDSKCYKYLDDKCLRKLAEKMGKEWKSVGSYLDIDTPKVNQHDINHPRNSLAAIFEMLQTWRDEKIGSATEDKLLLDLAEAFGEVGKGDVKKKILEYRRLSQQCDSDS